jgi:hypothetical protein
MIVEIGDYLLGLIWWEAVGCCGWGTWYWVLNGVFLREINVRRSNHWIVILHTLLYMRVYALRRFLILSFFIEIKVFKNFIFSLTTMFLSYRRKKTRALHLMLINMLTSSRWVPPLAAVGVTASKINMCRLIIYLVSYECVTLVCVRLKSRPQHLRGYVSHWVVVQTRIVNYDGNTSFTQ